MRAVVQPFGDAAWRARLPEGADPGAVLQALRAVAGVVDVVVCERHALATFDPTTAPAGLAAAIERAVADAVDRPPGPDRAPRASREHVVRVRYGPPDLDEVARRTGMMPADVVALHAAGTYVVAVVGFLPGFAYLRGLDPRLTLPRRDSPHGRIAPLSVGIAGPYTGVYPFASPGGWNIIGTAVGFTPFDPRSGAALSLGDRVRFAPEPS